MKLRRECAAPFSPLSAENASSISTPASGNFAHLKSAWPFALGGFVVGLLAGLFINRRNPQLGVTTRAQLRSAANTLHRLNAGALAFVMSQVRLVKANPAFRRSLPNMEQQLSDRDDSSSMWPVKWNGIIERPPREPETSAGDEMSHPLHQPAPQIADQDEAIPQAASAAAEKLPPLPVAEQSPSDEASRMERLRGLFANAAIENLHRSRGPVSQEEPAPLPPVTWPVKKAAEPAPEVRSSITPQTVTPREFIPVKEPARPPDDFTPGDLNDGIRILPSRRGQYGSR